ncbi:MAG: DUF4214 domain-containing protein [Pseudomonadota bacterium]
MSTTTEQIQKLYVAYFNRPADPNGLAYWSQVYANNGGNSGAIAAQFAASPEYKAAYAGMDHQQAVAAVYQNLFSRTGEPAGVAYWARLLDSGAITMDGVVKIIGDAAQDRDLTIFNGKVSAASAFTAALDTPPETQAYDNAASNLRAKQWLASIHNSDTLAMALAPEAVAVKVIDVTAQYGAAVTLPAATPEQFAATTHMAELQRLWMNYLDRPADPLGLQYWATQLELGTPQATVRNVFIASAEFKAIYAGLSSAQAVNTIYLHQFGHNADVASLLSWSSAIDNPQLALPDVIDAIGSGAKGADSFAYYAKLAVGAAFTNEIDSALEREIYSGPAAYALVRADLAGVNDAASLAAAIAPEAIHQLANPPWSGQGVAGLIGMAPLAVDGVIGGAGHSMQ